MMKWNANPNQSVKTGDWQHGAASRGVKAEREKDENNPDALLAMSHLIGCVSHTSCAVNIKSSTTASSYGLSCLRGVISQLPPTTAENTRTVFTSGHLFQCPCNLASIDTRLFLRSVWVFHIVCWCLLCFLSHSGHMMPSQLLAACLFCSIQKRHMHQNIHGKPSTCLIWNYPISICIVFPLPMLSLPVSYGILWNLKNLIAFFIGLFQDVSSQSNYKTTGLLTAGFPKMMAVQDSSGDLDKCGK